MTGRTPHQSSPRPLAGRGPALRAVPDGATAGDVTALRANAQVAALRVDDWPQYGSPEWLRLHPQDPRVYVATLEAAELHRIAEAERARLDWLMDNEPDEWWREITAEARRETCRRVRAAKSMESAVEVRVRQARAGRRPPHKLTASPGWPPVAIPGRPGEYLTYQETSA